MKFVKINDKNELHARINLSSGMLLDVKVTSCYGSGYIAELKMNNAFITSVTGDSLPQIKSKVRMMLMSFIDGMLDLSKQLTNPANENYINTIVFEDCEPTRKKSTRDRDEDDFGARTNQEIYENQMHMEGE